MYFTKPQFLKDATERAVKSAAQVAVLTIGGDMVNVIDVDWPTIGGFTLGAVVLSYLSSFGTGAVTQDGGPSLAKTKDRDPIDPGSLDDK